MKLDIERVAGEWSERLTALLRNEGRLHLLLNPLGGLEPALSDALSTLETKWPLADPYYGEAVAQAPLLVTITMAQLALLDRTAMAAAEAALRPGLPANPVCAWLCAALDGDALSRHLRRRMDLQMDGYDASVLFLYFDPRVMPRLPQVLEPSQMAALLGPVDLWLAPGRDGRLLALPRPQAPAAAGALRLTPPQADALDRVEAVNSAIRQLQARGHAVAPADDRLLDGFIQQAAELGLRTMEDRAAYALLAHLQRGRAVSAAHDEGVARGLELAVAGVPFSDYLRNNPTLLSEQP